MLTKNGLGRAIVGAALAAAGSTVLLTGTRASAQVPVLDAAERVEQILGLEIEDGDGNALTLDVRFVGVDDFLASQGEPAAEIDYFFVFNEFFEEPLEPFFADDAVGARNAAGAIASFLGTSLAIGSGAIASDGFVVPTDVGSFGPNSYSVYGDFQTGLGEDEILSAADLDIFGSKLPAEFPFATFSLSDTSSAAVPEGSQAIGLLVAGILTAGLKFGARAARSPE